jgi:hypothetical protein
MVGKPRIVNFDPDYGDNCKDYSRWVGVEYSTSINTEWATKKAECVHNVFVDFVRERNLSFFEKRKQHL